MELMVSNDCHRAASPHAATRSTFSVFTCTDSAERSSLLTFLESIRRKHLRVLLCQKPNKIQNYDVAIKKVNAMKAIKDICLEKLRGKFVFKYLKMSHTKQN